MKTHDFFGVKEATLATMHGKEQAIAPWFKSELGIDLNVAENLDTDRFGTFSGEIDRIKNPEQTARLKIEEVFRQNPQCRVAVASEGSFFPNPEFMLSTMNEELLLLIDRKTSLEVMVKHYSPETNMAKTNVSSLAEALKFADDIGFPSHGLILKTDEKATEPECWKGITSLTVLKEAFQNFLSKGKTVYMETDMRACYNPTRMDKISLAAQGLVLKLKSVCPSCNFPGFGITEYINGLPCENCYFPTRLLLSHFYQCKNCSHHKEEKFPNGKKLAYAGLCSRCNP